MRHNKKKFLIFWDRSELTKPFDSGCRPWQDRRTDRESRFGSRYGKKSKIFFLLKLTYNHLLRVKTCFLVFASLSLVSVVRCAAKKQKEICCAINTEFFSLLIYWIRDAQLWITFLWYQVYWFCKPFSF